MFTVGIDVGGTFTDLVAISRITGELRLAKVPTTVDNQAQGVMAALREAGLALTDVELIVHGTTATTNALLERKLAKVGLITTQGFRDSLELGRRTRPSPYGMVGHFEPIASRENRLEVAERLDAEGRVLVPLDEAAVVQALDQLIAQGCESLVIHFLHSYVNNSHESAALQLAKARWPNAYISVGHHLVSEYREYERGTTACVNASVMPILDRYLGRLQTELKAAGYGRDLLIMQGSGGTVAAPNAISAAVQTVMSGPASGVMAAAATARAVTMPNLITYDMGGTSTDVGLIVNGQPQVSSELELEYAMPLRVPLVDVHTVGAGGGSLASINDGGLLQVGPQSAGATPGPICFGRGGTVPTLTDANYALGRLSPERLLSVTGAASPQAVADRIERHIGHALGLNGVEAAAAMLRVGNDKMAGAVRLMSLARGHDPRDFVLFPFGGAGPLHACALAAELFIPRVLIPARPGLTNALGCALADLRHDYVSAINQPVSSLDMARVAETFAQHRSQGEAALKDDAVALVQVRALYAAELQFQGQSHVLRIPINSPTLTRSELQALFARAYCQRFQVELPEMKPVLVNLHTAVLGERAPINLGSLRGPQTRQAPHERLVWFSEGGFQTTPVFARSSLGEGDSIKGPAVIEQLDCTTVIEPGWQASPDSLGNLICERMP